MGGYKRIRQEVEPKSDDEDEHMKRIRARMEANDSDGSENSDIDSSNEAALDEPDSEGREEEAGRSRHDKHVEEYDSDDSGNGSESGEEEQNNHAQGDGYSDSESDQSAGAQQSEETQANDRRIGASIGDLLALERRGSGPSRRRGGEVPKRKLLPKLMAKSVKKPKQEDNSGDASSDSDGEGEKAAGNVDDRRGRAPHRANKNRPVEMSSKFAVGRHRQVVDVKNRKFRDPRFEPMSGHLNYEMFRKSYAFLDTYQDQEVELLRKSLRKEKGQEKPDQIHALLGRLQQERAERKRADALRKTLGDRKKQEAEAVAQGKQPYFLKTKDKRQLAKDQRFEELKKDGKLKKFLEKKRKRNAAKDRRWLPSQRRGDGGGGQEE